MARGFNAQLAVDLFDAIIQKKGWGQSEAWKAIASLLLTCDLQSQKRWEPFHDVVVFRESNDFRVLASGPNANIRKAEQLTSYLAEQLGVLRSELCSAIAQYWRHPQVSTLQQHNLVGNAFRSMVARTLGTFGPSNISYVEEQNARELFTGHQLTTRSENPKIDIVAFRDTKPIALLSTRWRFRHDRVDLTDEALAFSTPGMRVWGGIPYYAVLGEFSAARVAKVLSHAPPAQLHGPIRAVVHFQPELLSKGLGENGRVAELKSLSWLCDESRAW